MILHLYIARRFGQAIIAVSLVFAVLVMLIDLIDQLRRMAGTGAGFGQALQLAALHTPQTLYTLLPLLVILSTVALFLGLSRSSELIVTRATGRSALLVVVAPMVMAFLIGLMSLAVMNPIVAATAKQYDLVSARVQAGPDSALSLDGDGIWLRQGGENGQTVIRATRANAQGSRLVDATFFAYAPKGGLIKRIEAKTATLVPGAWDLETVKIWTLNSPSNPEATAEARDTMRLPSPLTIERIRDGFNPPSSIAIWDLPQYVTALEQAGFTARGHLVWLQSELARPLFLVAMVMISAAYTMRHARFGRTGLAVLTAVLVGFSLHYIKNFVHILGENGQIPVFLAAWAPPVAALMLSLGLMLHREDG